MRIESRPEYGRIVANERLGAWRDRIRRRVLGHPVVRRIRWSLTAVVRRDELERARRDAQRGALDEIRKRLQDGREFAELAETYAREKDELQAELDEAREQHERARGELEDTRAELANAAVQLAFLRAERSRVEGDGEDDEASAEAEGGERGSAPEPGSVVFYKKIHGAPRHDVMVRRGDCGHGRWQSAHKADKAKKGIERLEGSRGWKSLWHCGVCEGGGVWKVQW